MMHNQTANTSLLTAIHAAPLIPVVTLQHADDAVPLAEALAEGGVRCIEITLRTPAGMAGIAALAKANIGHMLVGVGTITNARQMRQAADAGATFFVSPGVTPELLDTARTHAFNLLPGVITPSEILMALNGGCTMLKFFPAESFGGVALLKNYANVFPQVSFCPTGGITPTNAREYLALANVACVGGTWLSPSDALASRDWKRITDISRDSLKKLGD